MRVHALSVNFCWCVPGGWFFKVLQYGMQYCVFCVCVCTAMASDSVNVSTLSDAELAAKLLQYGASCGPIIRKH